MDQFDRAQEIEAMYRDKALRDARKNRLSGESRRYCLECDEEIPEARRQAVPGSIHCIACAAEIEKGLI